MFYPPMHTSLLIFLLTHDPVRLAVPPLCPWQGEIYRWPPSYAKEVREVHTALASVRGAACSRPGALHRSALGGKACLLGSRGLHRDHSHRRRS
jgi:hypothetical protein